VHVSQSPRVCRACRAPSDAKSGGSVQGEDVLAAVGHWRGQGGAGCGDEGMGQTWVDPRVVDLRSFKVYSMT